MTVFTIMDRGLIIAIPWLILDWGLIATVQFHFSHERKEYLCLIIPLRTLVISAGVVHVHHGIIYRCWNGGFWRRSASTTSSRAADYSNTHL